MPKRTDIHSILIIGSGPIVIGQGCEFDYSGVQACRALKEEGYRIVLINSNPATIMTDPEFADATYIEPITPEAVEKVLAREAKGPRPVDAVLPTLGGQTGLNTAIACYDRGIFTRFGVRMIGADRQAIYRGEDRQVFKDLMLAIGLRVPRSGVVHNMDDARKVLEQIRLPLIIRPAFTLGGTGGGIAYNVEEFETIVQRGLDASPMTEVLIEQSVIGWKEYELEVMRDRNDNVVVICSIENMDPMGVHTGDSITVAPVQTLTDKEYQRMRDAAIAVIRAVGVETGGSNIQFAINPDDGEMVVVEMNPRVSRSSALASKATGFPIAKIAAKLAVGYTLDELPNDITKKTVACFEPTIDYCVIKIPRWTFEKFPDADETLTTQMKSVGEAMAIGRTFKEALQKGIRSMEVKRFGFGLDKYDKWLNAQRRSTGFQPVQAAVSGGESESSEASGRQHGLQTRATSAPLPPSARSTSGDDISDKTVQGESLDQEWPIPAEKLRRKLAVPSQGRLYYIRYAMKMGWSIDQIHELTKIDRWFLGQMKQLVEFEQELTAAAVDDEVPSRIDYFGLVRRAKEWGYSDVQLAQMSRLKPDGAMTPSEFRAYRDNLGVRPVYKLVDTCAAEFEAATPYYYSTYETPYQQLTTDNEQRTITEDEIRLTDKPKVVIIGGGPNRIGQGIEFDYCCVHAAFAMRELGIESVMVNSNPETVSTDYDTSDLLFFEPLTHEDILNICERLNGGPFASAVEDLTLDEDGYSILTVGGGLPPGIPLNWMEVVSGHADQMGLGPLGLLQAGVAGDVRSLHFVDTSGKFWVFEFQESTGSLIRAVPDAGAEWLWQNVVSAQTKELVQAFKKKRHAGAGLVKGVIVQFGGQTPLNLARGLKEAGVPILGTSVESLDAAGDREQFRQLLQKLDLKQPANGIARSVAEARQVAREIGYPVLVRPSFVLGGRAMEIVSDESRLNYYMTHAVEASTIADAPILIDKFLDAATEVDVDCVADFDPEESGFRVQGSGIRAGEVPAQPDGSPIDRHGSAAPITQHPALSTQHSPQAIIIGVMEHIEEAGIHSGDSACALPPYSLPPEIVIRLKDQTRALAKALRVRGLMNVQYAIKDSEIYVIEVNPRASRTVPFVSKATGVPWAKIAAKVMAGKSLAELGARELPDPKHTSVKESVFPFTKFPGVDVILGPEMRSTGEVMGIDQNFPLAFAKSQIAAGSALPTKGTVFISVRDGDKEAIIPAARMLAGCGFQIIATEGTFNALARGAVPATRISKLSEGRPNIKDFIKNKQVQLIINTPTRKGPQTDEGKIRAMAVLNKVPIVTTITGASAAARAIQAMQAERWDVRPLQDYFAPRASE